eukprot:TRINITY_DN11592_c0_g1_i2.p1 TRINITY_DN11592_c0_g1~~TRINITY_DN11592_c0_g1_i2.p1  ORF type:complete len:140 (+),score=23.18 TRINITY_DN11592_c0_g1_i2:310-729(+)
MNYLTQDDFGFRGRILGAEECNIHRLLETVGRENPPKRNEETSVELRLCTTTRQVELPAGSATEELFSLYVFARSNEVFLQATKLAHELLANVVEEYKRYAEKLGKDMMSDPRIRRTDLFFDVTDLRFEEPSRKTAMNP